MRVTDAETKLGRGGRRRLRGGQRRERLFAMGMIAERPVELEGHVLAGQ